MSAFAIVSFVVATATVAVLTRLWVRRLDVAKDAAEEYFSGGRALTWPVVAGSLLLTNLSTEQLVGLNGAVFGDGNLVAMAWEALAAVAMVVTALTFLPRYFRSGFTTTPAFLEECFDYRVRGVVSLLFLLGYVTVLAPVVLYTGSLALIGMFDLQLPLAVISTGIGLLGAGYAVFGGLKSVAVSDTINGVGLLVGGLAVPALALAELGEGSALGGLQTLLRDHPERFVVLGGPESSVPWPTLLTGMMLIQLFYWSTNQVIVQRALGARTLADGQRGVLFAAGLKLLGPLMLCIPGLVALHLPGLELTANDQAYPAVVRRVLPEWSLGLFAAVLVGSILSSFNSALNSASTLFSLEFYQTYIDPQADDPSTVRAGQRFAIAVAIAAMALAPALANAGSIFAYLQKINGLYSVPIIAVFLAGLAWKRATAKGAIAGMAVGLGCYSFFTFGEPPGLHWLHGYAISFGASLVAIVIVSLLDRSDARGEAPRSVLEVTPEMAASWPLAGPVAISLCVVLGTVYALLTGLAA